MLIAVVGSTGLDRVAGIPLGRPASLLRVVAERPDQLVLVLAPRYAATTAREQADLVAAARPNARVDVVISDHHPLTLTLVADRALRVAERTGAVDVTPVVEAGLAAARSLVWCSSGWQLRGADLSLGQRLRSLGDGPGFFLELGRRPWLGAARNGWRPRSRDRLYTVGPIPDLLTEQLGVTVASRIQVGVAPGAPYAPRAARLLTALLPPVVADPGSAAGTDLTHESEAAVSMNPRQNRGVTFMVLAVGAAALDRDGVVLQVATLRPWLGGTRPRLRASATIEAPAGALAAWGVRVGSRLAYEATAFLG